MRDSNQQLELFNRNMMMMMRKSDKHESTSRNIRLIEDENDDLQRAKYLSIQDAYKRMQQTAQLAIQPPQQVPDRNDPIYDNITDR